MTLLYLPHGKPFHLHLIMRHFEPVLHKILSAFYRAFPKDEVLAATCAHLMRGSRTREEDFPWYEKAVERGIRLTRLFEYYMLS